MISTGSQPSWIWFGLVMFELQLELSIDWIGLVFQLDIDVQTFFLSYFWRQNIFLSYFWAFFLLLAFELWVKDGGFIIDFWKHLSDPKRSWTSTPSAVPPRRTADSASARPRQVAKTTPTNPKKCFQKNQALVTFFTNFLQRK